MNGAELAVWVVLWNLAGLWRAGPVNAAMLAYVRELGLVNPFVRP